MDHQGAGRTRSAADTRRQPPWATPDGAGTGAQRILRPGAGPQRSIGPGAGPQRSIGPGAGPQRSIGPGTGPQRTVGSASGPHTVLSRGSGPQPVLNPDTAAQPTFSGPGSGPQPAAFSEPAATGSFRVGTGYRADGTEPIGLLAPDAGQQAAPPRRRRGTRPRRGSRSRLGWLATAVVVAAVAALAGYRFLYEPRVNAPVPPTLRLPTTAPGSPGFDKTLGKWQHIGTRTEDPSALTIAGLYPPQFVLDGTSYVRTAASVTKTCSLAVYGANLQAALQSGHCTQVVRASYISGDGTMMGTVGVVNLISSSAAQEAGQATGPQEIIAPLTGKKGASSKLGDGTGVVQAEIKGHYLILMYAEFASLKSPSDPAQRQALEQFATNLVTGTANIDLSTRMLTGKL